MRSRGKNCIMGKKTERMMRMDRDRCPACGARGYRGKHCGECLYVPFMEEVAHGTHYHYGEPLVLDRRPQSLRPGQGCASYSGRRTGSAAGAVRAVLWVLGIGLLFFMPILGVPVLLLANAMKKGKRA